MDVYFHYENNNNYYYYHYNFYKPVSQMSRWCNKSV